jgi:sporulation protein YlmC with PRC-barrel domain
MTKFSICAAALFAAASPALGSGLAIPSPQLSTHTTPLVRVAAAAMSRDELAHLVGRPVRTNGGQKIGNIEGIYVNRDGSVKQVIVEVGSFLGVDNHDVALGWDNLHFASNGDIVVRISKKDLKAMPKYEYAKSGFRGTVFGDAD